MPGPDQRCVFPWFPQQVWLVWIEGIPKKISSVTFTVLDVTHSDLSYAPADDHDPDGDSVITSGGTSITVAR